MDIRTGNLHGVTTSILFTATNAKDVKILEELNQALTIGLPFTMQSSPLDEFSVAVDTKDSWLKRFRRTRFGETLRVDREAESRKVQPPHEHPER